ncbi:Crustapain [Tritrichomonas foetus]|uniref:Crustapain n=1 Tax=Tritrichomonas foetus TaxID=1144522 RepID=A0A1J4JTV7_9EUKA|nr:Crustapain [Tritrichomonas foetus]|eukprot:OHT02178.1 Crustapain [Tritrichomonas foetus]
MFIFLVELVTSKVFLHASEERSFIQWMRNTNQFYTGAEYHFRLGIYLSHSRWIRDFNKGKHTFKVGHNKFSAFTTAEYESLLGAKYTNPARKSLSKSKPLIKSTDKQIPESLDWRDRNLVNTIRNQMDCGSCWAFSAIASCEAAYSLVTGKLLQFSEQNLVDCVEDAFGCFGGWPSDSIDHIVTKQNGKFNSPNNYPYVAIKNFDCTFDEFLAIGSVSGYYEVTKEDENDLLEKVANHGVVSVCIHSGDSEFKLYTGGIFDLPSCSKLFLDHAVDVVGYGSENGKDYWIVRNSWGNQWGEEGYVRMSRNKDNQCGIASSAIVAYTEVQ